MSFHHGFVLGGPKDCAKKQGSVNYDTDQPKEVSFFFTSLDSSGGWKISIPTNF